MGKIKDLTGQRFGRLTVIERAERRAKNGCVYWECLCDCGNSHTVVGEHLRDGHVKSCGCINTEKALGKSKSRLYTIWSDMKTRCYNPNNNRYYRYGGRGITVCEEWKNDFKPFYNWAMANGYTGNLTLDRIDNNKGYSPDNCRWKSYKEQGNNKSNNRLITYNGKTQTLSQWADELGINICTLNTRINTYHWDIERALTEKIHNRGQD